MNSYWRYVSEQRKVFYILQTINYLATHDRKLVPLVLKAPPIYLMILRFVRQRVPCQRYIGDFYYQNNFLNKHVNSLLIAQIVKLVFRIKVRATRPFISFPGISRFMAIIYGGQIKEQEG